MLLDFSMPRATGLDVLEALRDMGHGSVRVLMTGHHAEWILQRARALGAVGAMFKPIDPVLLCETLTDVPARSSTVVGGFGLGAAPEA